MAYCNNVDIEKWKKGILKRYLWKIWYYGSGLKNGWINKRSQPWPNYLLFCKSVARRESLWRVGKKERKKSNKLAWFYYMNTPFVRKIVSNPSTCLFVQRFLYERKCGFYRQHIPSSLQPFRRLVLPHALIAHPKETFFLARGKLHDIIWSGLVQFVENLPRCSLMDRLLWYDRSQFRHIYVHEPIMDLIFLYIGQEPMVSAVTKQQNR